MAEKLKVEKSVAYITHQHRLLVFIHLDFPEAGVQVPGGTLRRGEDPAMAAMRESKEETGLENLRLIRHLGTQEIPDSQSDPAWFRRHFYHIEAFGPVPERWEHEEADPSDGSPGPIRLEFYWVEFEEHAPSLHGGLGVMLHILSAAPNPAG